MATAIETSVANTNHSLRTIRNELEFLCDLQVISQQQLQSILTQLPAQIPLHQPLLSPLNGATTTPTESFVNTDVKQSYSPIPSPAPQAPPAYPVGPSILSIAVALYAYTPTDAGDLALQQNDRVLVTEHMNNDWWKGRNERTGLEGIFPRSYVNVVDEKRPPIPMAEPGQYGNMPLALAQAQSGLEARRPSKLEEHGKKFGKKMGNAAIFGAGATLGSNLVNGIF